jgi:non-specific serine/threonine protein kinase/serine/threonine-protein kinase
MRDDRREPETTLGDGRGRAEGPPSAETDGVGNYRILQRLGEGGMGAVYLAEQLRPVRRRVALKLIKPGMDTRQVLARFEAERQALAVMNHPSIARVYDAGVTERERPFFAMEYVEGVPIDDYCDTHRLDTEERLKLFLQVCDGVQHAHHKGIIHRDIKPSNVLVTIQEDRPVPKIIDFGVAKAIAQRLTEQTMFTQLGVPVGTPEFMSPEQAELTSLDVDTRTDVYSLGVLLYLLLVGTLPFEPLELREAGLDELRRKIREDEPPRPSTRLSTFAAAGREAEQRRTDLGSLQRALVGDLDWITMKALEKDRTRRYGSPGELAADIGRHLSHQPVLAGPPSTVYRMKKFLRRHRTGAAAAALVLLALVLGIVGTSYGLVRARRAEAAAREEAATAQQVSRFLTELFEASDPNLGGRGASTTARELLDAGARSIDRDLADQPVVQARLMYTIGNISQRLGLYPQAARLLETTLEIRRERLGAAHPETLEAWNDLAVVYRKQGRYEQAEAAIRGTLEARREVLGDNDPETLQSINVLGNVLWSEGRFDEAETLYVEALELRRRVLGPEHPDTLQSMNDLAVVYDNQRMLEQAKPLYEEALRLRRRVLGDEHPDTLRSINNLAILYLKQRRFAEAEPLYVESLESRRKLLGERHPATARSMSNLARLYHVQGQYAKAEPLFHDALRIQQRVLGEDHPDTANTVYNLACISALQGRLEQAIDRLTDAVRRGWARALIFDDSDLFPLRGDPRYESILAELRARLDLPDRAETQAQ